MSTAVVNGHANGINGTSSADQITQLYPRYGDIPDVFDIPVRGEDGDEVVNLDLTELLDETDELCGLLETENASKDYWITIAIAYAKLRKVNVAVEMLQRGLAAHARGKDADRLSILACLCWLHLWKCRHAPRVRPTQPRPPGHAEEDDLRTKDEFLHLATNVLNDASRIDPSYPPLFMARGTLYLLRASIQPAKAQMGAVDQTNRFDILRQAGKCFDDAIRSTHGRNIFALLGKARVEFSLSKTQSALQLYQQALERAPDMLDPDPRIGIGVCLWTLGHKEAAYNAWQRSVELNPQSVIAHSLLGKYWVDQLDSSLEVSHPHNADLYRKGYTTHFQTGFKLDPMHALTCAQFGSYFLQRRAWTNVERLARRALEQTDVNAIASDGWYLLALQAHYEGSLDTAADAYNKADNARGGDEKGFVPAKFGNAQLRVLGGDVSAAKFRLEKIVEKSRSLEAMTLLGVLFAEDVFANQAATVKEDKTQEAKKAVSLLEQVRVAWKDPKRKAKKDASVLLNLARLYESEEPAKALSCLKETEEILLSAISEDDLPDEMGDEEEEKRIRRELLPPQLLNNIGCFHFGAEKFAEARDDFQTALNASVKLKAKRDQAKEESETNGEVNGDAISYEHEALLTTIGYNLARTYEAEGIDDEAQKVYEGTLLRHPDYIDARMRLAYLALKSNPTEGAEAVKALLESDPGNLEVRALYGWYIHTAKKRTLALNEDAEQRHYKHTLQSYDKHDTYALTGMGNLHLAIAREMPRDTDAHREKRSKMYLRAVEFFDKVLSLDPRNAFAAQGLGIALVEEKRDPTAAVQIFSRIRESVGGAEASVFVNLGHVFTEVKQFSRAVESYELALTKSNHGAKEPGILACLGRVWLIRGRMEKKLEAYKTSLDFAQQALLQAPGNVNYRFNVAFVQMQLAQMLIALPEAQRTLEDVEQASAGLDEAIESFALIAKEPNPPFPRGDIEQRASMGRNTMKRQLAATMEKQAEYERNNAERLQEAKRRREEAAQKREEAAKAEQQRREEEMRKIREERERIAQEDRELMARRAEEEKTKKEAEEAAFTTDEETGERKKRERKKGKGKRKKKGEDSDDEGSGDEGRKGRSGNVTGTSGTPGTGSDGEGVKKRKTKKRKLERKSKGAAASQSKFKSADMVVESDEEDDGTGAAAGPSSQMDGDGDGEEMFAETPGGAQTPGVEDEDEEVGGRAATARSKRRVLDDDEDEDEDAEPQGVTAAGSSDHGGGPLGGDD
ncbi:protein required for normal CLN1 and CLN2 G1 cyclin expression [Saxophila tyrrhenica]|uniref:Protein required for normal CLN1 and CLN2 G1 cyclin expression n=1 Tax=Saxophila tyrrhenica TaxID=1690608 RepID=A0AAV9P163_9PEZI|nr:protein required for normal CLN1 and CLN2 G1 cyclin expression [Saxophila tyrrhenica]